MKRMTWVDPISGDVQVKVFNDTGNEVTASDLLTMYENEVERGKRLEMEANKLVEERGRWMTDYYIYHDELLKIRDIIIGLRF